MVECSILLVMGRWIIPVEETGAFAGWLAKSFLFGKVDGPAREANSFCRLRRRDADQCLRTIDQD
jgi:hypothetical protein